MTDTQLINVEDSLGINYLDNGTSRTLNIKYINPDATDEQLLTFAKMLHNTFMATTFVSATRTSKGTLYKLEG